ncbi:MAG: hypothetical protein JNL32_14785, partial [Candidatus Kapabacteria bacterium]|nr:hypothetical protein [Candidatus Kapabacteria bacterium]
MDSMKTRLIAHSIILIHLFFLQELSAQHSLGGTPRTYEALPEILQTYSVPVRTLSGDIVRNEGKSVSRQYNVQVDILREGIPVQHTAEGTVRLFALVLHSQTALLIFDKFDIDDATTLYAYDARRHYVYGAFASNNMRPGQPFVLRVDNVDTLILECTSSSPVETEHMRLQSVTTTTLLDNSNGEEEIANFQCLLGVDCEEADDFCVERFATCMILDNNKANWNCTGTLLNIIGPQGVEPLILTARHCLNNLDNLCALSEQEIQQLNSWVFRFRFWSGECGPNQFSRKVQSPYSSNVEDLLPSDQIVEFTGAELVAVHKETDMLLVKITDANFTPAVTKKLYFAGWDRTELTKSTMPASITFLQHTQVPANVYEASTMQVARWSENEEDVKIPYGWSSMKCRDTPQDISYVWLDLENGIGALGAGASGGAAWNDQKRVIGHINSGELCGKPAAIFAPLSNTWVGGGTPESALRDHLSSFDPNTSTMTIDGYSHEILPVYKVRIYNRNFDLNRGDVLNNELSRYLDNASYPQYHIKALSELEIGGGAAWTPQAVPASSVGNTTTTKCVVQSETPVTFTAGRKVVIKAGTRFEMRTENKVKVTVTGPDGSPDYCGSPGVTSSGNRIPLVTVGDRQWTNNGYGNVFSIMRKNPGSIYGRTRSNDEPLQPIVERGDERTIQIVPSPA